MKIPDHGGVPPKTSHIVHEPQGHLPPLPPYSLDMGVVRPLRETSPEPVRIWSRPRALLALAPAAVLIGLLLLSACGSGALTEEDRAAAEFRIYAAVTRQLVEIDNTFGSRHRFSRILILDYLDPHAGDAMNQGRSGRSLSEEQQQTIIAAIDHLGPIEFISDGSLFIREDVLEPVIPGSVIITLAPADFDDDGATVGANLWCGGTCGLWLTYRVVEGPDGWTVGGREGTWAIS